MLQQEIDKRNAEFWDELCGSSLARGLGITEASSESLQRFDEAYMAIYPYLDGYVLREPLGGKKVLEIGLGYGTLGQIIAAQGCVYYGLDIAEGPVMMMRYRLDQLGQNGEKQVRVGSALDIPYDNSTFDYVYSIGCLHHTGNIGQSIAEVYRVLKPGGKAIIMLYNRYSFRQLIQVRLMRLYNLFKPGMWANFNERVRALYDTNEQGEAAPHTDYVSWFEVKRIFKSFSRVKIDIQNFDTYVLFNGKVVILREKLLNNVGRVLGLDLYITATK